VGVVPFLRTAGSTAGPKVAWAEAYLHTKWHLNSSSRLAATDIGRKFGGLCPVPVQHIVHWAEAYLRTKWHLDPSSRSATINMGRKLGVGLFPVELLEILENWLSECFTCAGPMSYCRQQTIFFYCYHPTRGYKNFYMIISEDEFEYLRMNINTKKTCCVRI